MSVTSHNTLTGTSAASDATPHDALAGVHQIDLKMTFFAAFPALVIAIASAVLAALMLLAPTAMAQLAATATEDAIGTSILSLAFAGGTAAFAALILAAIYCLDATRND